jgi:hypothetical protein
MASILTRYLLRGRQDHAADRFACSVARSAGALLLCVILPPRIASAATPFLDGRSAGRRVAPAQGTRVGGKEMNVGYRP